MGWASSRRCVREWELKGHDPWRVDVKWCSHHGPERPCSAGVYEWSAGFLKRSIIAGHLASESISAKASRPPSSRCPTSSSSCKATTWTAATPSSRCSCCLRPFSAIGQVSYSLYLWPLPSSAAIVATRELPPGVRAIPMLLAAPRRSLTSSSRHPPHPMLRFHPKHPARLRHGNRRCLLLRLPAPQDDRPRSSQPIPCDHRERHGDRAPARLQQVRVHRPWLTPECLPAATSSTSRASCAPRRCALSRPPRRTLRGRQPHQPFRRRPHSCLPRLINFTVQLYLVTSRLKQN